MSVSLTIRDLPEATRDMLRQRAEANRQSLNSYIVDLLEREAGLPTMSEWADMVESRARLAGSSDAAVEAVRELRDAE
jgi:antitoxin FitA